MYEDKKNYYTDEDLKINDDRTEQIKKYSIEAVGRERDIFREMNYDFLTGLPSMTYFFNITYLLRQKNQFLFY